MKICFYAIIKDYGFDGKIKHSDLYKFEIKDKTLGKYNISERDKCY